MRAALGVLAFDVEKDAQGAGRFERPRAECDGLPIQPLGVVMAAAGYPVGTAADLAKPFELSELVSRVWELVG